MWSYIWFYLKRLLKDIRQMRRYMRIIVIDMQLLLLSFVWSLCLFVIDNRREIGIAVIAGMILLVFSRCSGLA